MSILSSPAITEARPEAFGRQNIAPLAVSITEQRDARRAVRIVFDRFDFRWHIEFVALKIDQSIESFMPAAPMIRGDPTGVVTPTAMMQRVTQTLFRPGLGDLIESEPVETVFPRRWGGKS